MTQLSFLVFRTFFITMMTVGMMASLTEFRFGYRKLLPVLAVYGLWAAGSSLVLLELGGELLLLRLFYLTISLPAILLTYWSANDTPAQAVFNYTTQIMVSALSASMIRWVTESLGLSGTVNLLLMCVFYPTLIYLQWRFLRKPFRMLIRVLPDRWGVLTIIPCVFCGYLILVSTWPGSYLENLSQRIYIYAAIIPMVFVYIAVFKSLLAQYHIQMERQSAALLTVQISALKEKLTKVKEVEEGIRIQRHDLRHQLQAVSELVARGTRSLPWLSSTRPGSGWMSRRRSAGASRRCWTRSFPPTLTRPATRRSPCGHRSPCPTPSRWTKGSWPSSWPTPWKTPFTPTRPCPRPSGRSGARWWGPPASCWSSPIRAPARSSLTATACRWPSGRGTAWGCSPSLPFAKRPALSVSSI